MPPTRRGSDTFVADHAAPMLHRCHHRFGGTGTIVTLDDGWAFTAAHCLAPVDGTPGVVITSASGAAAASWRVVKRWSPEGTDLALLQALRPAEARARTRAPHRPAPREGLHLAARALVRAGVAVTFVGHTGRGFQELRAHVIAVTATSATAVVEHPTGVCANDSGGPVLVGGVLVGIVTHRAGPVVSPRCAAHLVFARLDAPAMRRRIRAARPAGPWR